MTVHRAAAPKTSPVALTVDGTPVAARAGESVATALMADGRLAFRGSPRSGQPRGAFCMMGVCQECVLRVDGVRRPACMAEVRDGMVVETGG